DRIDGALHVFVFVCAIAFDRNIPRAVRSRERPAVRSAHRHYAWQGREPLLQLLEEREAVFRGVTAQCRIDGEGREIFGLKPRILGEQMNEADAKEAGSYQKQKRQGELAGHQDLTPARVRKLRSDAAGRALERRRSIR